MSLFKAREWWHAQGHADEEYEGACLCVGQMGNDLAVRIVTGSLQGNLRVYLPKQRNYQADDLLLETELDHAILQLECGRFSAAGGTQLAVLHPHKLVVYNLQAMAANYLQLVKLYEHGLEHTAANMVFGQFGGVQGRDYMAVQSYDGQLVLFEGETPAFSRFLPNFLIPGPLAYIEAADSFVTCSASFELECYKYKVLAAASADKQTENKDAIGHQTAKRVQADWRVILGEAAVEIRAGRVSSGLQAFQADIVVLCEHNVFIVSSQGQITFQKRLEYHPACCTTYPVPGSKQPGGPENLLVCTHHRMLLVYRQAVLSWAAKLDVLPIAVHVAEICSQHGMIVTLDGTGNVVVSYLGTDPMTTPVGLSEGKALDYEAMSREHRHLATIIRDAGSGQRLPPLDKLILRAQVPSVMDRHGVATDTDNDGSSQGGSTRGSAQSVTARLSLQYEGPGGGADDVLITVRTPEGISIEEVHMPHTRAATFVQTSITVPLVRGTDPTIIPLTFSTAPTASLPTSSTANVMVSYSVPGGEPRAQKLDVELPMCLFCTLVPPVKSGVYKITVATNRAPPLMHAIFEDMVAQTPPQSEASLQAPQGVPAGANVLSFHLPAGPDITIVVSKTGGRYRLHSDSFEAMGLVLQELCKRLHAYYREAESGAPPAPEGPFVVTFEETLPMDDFFEVVDAQCGLKLPPAPKATCLLQSAPHAPTTMQIVDAHFDLRLRAVQQRKQLEDRAVQFRSIQKRLLMRFKDKNPSSLNQLDYLLEETYNGIIDLGNALEHTQDQLKSLGIRLAAAVQLVLQLIRYRFGMSDREYGLLCSCLSTEVNGGDIGWEEATEMAMTHLLRTALAKNAKEAAVTVLPLAPAKNTQKLKKHLSLVLERLARGMRLAVGEDDEDGQAEVVTMHGGGGGGGGGSGGSGGTHHARGEAEQSWPRLRTDADQGTGDMGDVEDSEGYANGQGNE